MTAASLCISEDTPVRVVDAAVFTTFPSRPVMESPSVARKRPPMTLLDPAPVSYTHLDVYKRQILAPLHAKLPAVALVTAPAVERLKPV